MIENFLEILQYSFETFQDSLVVNSAKLRDEILTLELAIHFEDEKDNGTEKYSLWEVKCSGIRKQKIVLGDCLSYDFSDEKFDHILKWKYTKPYRSISFYGKPKSSLEVIGGLYKVHIETVENWIPFDTFFNMSLKLENLLSGGFGLLAERVPEPLAFAYENTLKNYGVSAKCSKPRLATYWGGEKQTNRIVPVSLLILGESEIIAEKIEMREISSRKV